MNYYINNGYKALTRDLNLRIKKGPARADKEGGLIESVSEKPNKFSKLAVCFQPNGSLIAGFQIRELADKTHKHEIIFWESNGLRHGNFELPLIHPQNQSLIKIKSNSDCFITNIQWNQHSSILALLSK